MLSICSIQGKLHCTLIAAASHSLPLQAKGDHKTKTWLLLTACREKRSKQETPRVQLTCWLSPQKSIRQLILGKSMVERLQSEVRQSNIAAGASPFPNTLPMAQRTPRKQPAFWRGTFNYWALHCSSQTATGTWTTSNICAMLTVYWCFSYLYSFTIFLPRLLTGIEGGTGIHTSHRITVLFYYLVYTKKQHYPAITAAIPWTWRRTSVP